MSRTQRTRSLQGADWLVILADVVAVVAIIGALVAGGRELSTRYVAEQINAEREAAIAAISTHLDKRFLARNHYNPEAADEETWFGFSPTSFPPGPEAPWASDARWNQIDHRPASSSTRYGIYTLGEEAWLMVYSDADRDGTWSQLYRHYAEGRLVHEWRVRDGE